MSTRKEQWVRLYKAAQEGDLFELQNLIENGADVTYQHEDFVNSPLIAAAQNGYLEVVKYLIEKDANPFYQSKVSKKTAKDYAKERGYLPVFNYLDEMFSEKEIYIELLNSFSLN